MSNMNERKDAFESKYAHDEAMAFKVEARGSKFLGLWIAEKLGLSGANAETYAKEVIAANLDEPGFDDIMRKVTPDLDAKNIAYNLDDLHTKMASCIEEAKISLMNDEK